MTRCTACSIELKASGLHQAHTLGDCWPLCSVCLQKYRSSAVSGQSLIRKLYAAGRSVSSCQACESGEGLEIHFIRPLATGGKPESANLLVLCRACHDKVHAGAHIRGKSVGIIKHRK